MFDLSTYAPNVREAFRAPATFWPTCVQEAVESGERDPDRLTDLVFFMYHPERMTGMDGEALDSDESGLSCLVEEWMQFRTAILPIANPVESESEAGRRETSSPADDWQVSETERTWLKRLGGSALVEWNEVAPIERGETMVFASPKKDLKGVFAWKSRRPSETCLANPHQRLQLYLAPPESEAYWRRRYPFGSIATITATTNKSMNRAYRQHIIRDKICPKRALVRETQTKRQLILQMAAGLYGVMPVLGPPGSETFKSFGKLVEAMAATLTAGAH